MINGSLDYTKCNFECRLTKEKKILTNKIKYSYMLNEFFIICNVMKWKIKHKKIIIKKKKKKKNQKEPYKKAPDKVIELKPNSKVIWTYNKQKVPYVLTGFILVVGRN